MFVGFQWQMKDVSNRKIQLSLRRSNVRNGSRRDVIGQRVLGFVDRLANQKGGSGSAKGDQLCSKGIYECRLDVVVPGQRHERTVFKAKVVKGGEGGVGRGMKKESFAREVFLC